MVECSVGGCGEAAPPGEMLAVRGEIDGQPIVGMACSVAHAEQLEHQWATGDRYSVPDEIWRTVGNGQVAA